MSNDLNQCQFIGRLGREVETRHTQNGKAVASFSIAVGSSWKNSEGEKQESVEWVNITAFDKLAEICEKYLSKGSQVYISGRMKTDKYTDKQGIEKYTTKVIADKMQMIGGKGEREERLTGKSTNKSTETAEEFRAVDDSFNDSIPF